MSNFALVKSYVNISEVCARYGVILDRAHKAPCPFHQEKTASFVVFTRNNRFKCFGCNKGGDVIDFVAALTGREPLEAAKLLNSDFGLGLDFEKPDPRTLQKLKREAARKAAFKKWVHDSLNIMCEYRRILWFSKQDGYPLFIEALEQLDLIDYYIDWLEKKPEQFYRLNRKVVEDIGKRLSSIHTGRIYEPH